MPNINITELQLIEMNKLFEMIDDTYPKIIGLLKKMKQRRYDLSIESLYRYKDETKYGHCNTMQFEYLLNDVKQIQLLINPICEQMNNPWLAILNHHQIE